MRILSLKLKSVIITALVILAVVIVVFLTAHTLSEAVFANERMIPIYNVDHRQRLEPAVYRAF